MHEIKQMIANLRRRAVETFGQYPYSPRDAIYKLKNCVDIMSK